MHAFLVTVAVVFLSEFGDKTQMLAFLLATRFRKPVPIVFGLVLATAANHLLATLLGISLAEWMGRQTLRWLLGGALLAMAVLMLLPERQGKGGFRVVDRLGPFGATLLAYFVVEMGDKTQLATVALGARYDNIGMVTLGSTLGIALADIPAIFLGGILSERFSLAWMRAAAAAIFLTLGIVVLAGGAKLL